MLTGVRKKQTGKNKPRRQLPFSIIKAILAVVLMAAAIGIGSIYLQDINNIFAGILTALFFGSAVFFGYTSVKPIEGGFIIEGKRKYTGKENALIWWAYRNPQTGLDVPIKIDLCTLNHPPKFAQKHYFVNWKRHLYELYNNTETKKLEPVLMPDKTPCSPAYYNGPAMMPATQRALQHHPYSKMEKVAPGLLMLAMFIVGILMLITTG